MLLSHPAFQELVSATRERTDLNELNDNPKDSALSRLTALRVHINDLEREVIGVGHNNPPESLDLGGPARIDFTRAREDIAALESEVQRLQPDEKQVRDRAGRLLDFGLKIALWASERATKFTDAALAVLAPIVVAKVTGLMPLLVETVRSVVRVLH